MSILNNIQEIIKSTKIYVSDYTTGVYNVH